MQVCTKCKYVADERKMRIKTGDNKEYFITFNFHLIIQHMT